MGQKIEISLSNVWMFHTMLWYNSLAGSKFSSQNSEKKFFGTNGLNADPDPGGKMNVSSMFYLFYWEGVL